MPSETSRILIYGVEFGPIIKLIGIKNILLSYILQGVGYWSRDRTLVAEGSDVFVSCQALSLLLKQYLTCLAHLIPEAIVRTDTTIAGVDYNPALCGFEGDKLTVISEFAVKTVLEKFKMAIEKGGHTS
jgi:hypothetical protein